MSNQSGVVQTSQKTTKHIEYLWVEEITGERKDIDGFRKFIAEQRRLDRENQKIEELDGKQENMTSNIKRVNNKKLTSFLRENSIFQKRRISETSDSQPEKAHNSVQDRISLKERMSLLKINVIVAIKKKDNMSDDEENDKNIEISTEPRPQREKTGFSATVIKSLYPSTFYKEREGIYDIFAKQKSFSSENVIANETLALPAAEFVYFLVKSSIENEGTKETKKMISQQVKETSLGFDIMFDFNCYFIEQIFKVF